LEGLVKTKLRSSEVWRYFGEIVKGYAHMKEQGYIHRDLKPANILIKNGAVKVADFGFAKLVRPGQTIKEKYNLGSPMYMAPESLK
jgi:serine/threonine protein kinase